MITSSGWEWLVNEPALAGLLLRLGINLAFATAVLVGIYGRAYRNRDSTFSCYLLNLITFLLCYLMQRVSIHMGVALALFGVFGILRYRTEQIRVRDLTYLFVVIGMGVVNAIADRSVSLVELLVINGVILFVTGVLELGGSGRHERSTMMHYDRLELLQPGRESELLEDLRRRTGLAVLRVELGPFDLLRDSAELQVVYRAVPRGIAASVHKYDAASRHISTSSHADEVDPAPQP
jgi:hypothetical protein